jgi:glycosyltransferase EpsD
MGHSVTVMARGDGADIDMPFEKKLFSPKNTACRKRIRRIVREGGYDAILLNTTLAAFHVRFALGVHRPRVVNVVHGYLFSRTTGFIKRTLLLLCEKLVAGKTDAIIVMNEEDREIAVRHKLTRGKVDTVRGFGVSVRDVITPPEKIREQYGRGSYALLFVGELSARKNQALLIRSLPEVVKHIPNAVLWLVGDGAERESLERLTSELGLSERVFFMGKRADACDFMRAADLYVSAAHIEGLPFNIVEALGTGKFVVASDIKGHRDVINSARVGLLYPDGDSSALVRAIAEAYDNLPNDTSAAMERYEYYEKNNVFSEIMQTIVYNLKIASE